MTSPKLADLTRHGWSLPILSEIANGTVARSGPLVAKTGGSRGGVEKAILHLIEIGMLEHNPGYGHPLRPEFLLTREGKAIAQNAKALSKEAYAMNAEGLIRKRWTLPVLGEVDDRTLFSDVRRALTPITDRALSLCLKEMGAHRLIKRKVWDGNPPVPLYSLTRRGQKLAELIPELK